MPLSGPRTLQSTTDNRQPTTYNLMPTINDIVLVHFEGQPIFFARIEDINPDHKKDWYQVKLLILQVPLKTVTWILREGYINGEEFTMGGNRMRLEKVEAPAEDEPDGETTPSEAPKDPEDSPRNSPESSLEGAEDAGKSGKATVIPFNAPKPDTD